MCTLEFSLLHERVNQCVSMNTWLKNDVLEVAFNPVDVVCGLPGGDAGKLRTSSGVDTVLMW